MTGRSLRDRLLDEAHRLLRRPTSIGMIEPGKQHRVAQRQDRDDLGNLDGAFSRNAPLCLPLVML